MVLKTPHSSHGGHTAPNDPDANDNAAHPHAWAKSCHDKIRREIKYHIADIEQS
jgi:hypothetical protein